MRLRLKYLVLFFAIFIALFVAAKVAFLLYNIPSQQFGIADAIAVIWHGLPLDLSTASYLCIVPLLVCLLSLFIGGGWTRIASKIYSIVVAPLLSLILVADIALYPFWQFKLDATIFNYLSDPANALTSVSPLFVAVALLCVAALTAIQLLALRFVWKRSPVLNKSQTSDLKSQILNAAALIFVGGLMFLMIRGGVGRSTMNVGRVYYSQNQFLNHAAVNPAFSLLSSSLKVQHFDRLYRYFPADECDSLFAQMHYSTESVGVDTLLRSRRPNIVMIVMEGCGSVFTDDSIIAPNLHRLSREGVFFSNCYANSFRTDRGLVCALSGYPAFPDISVMKLPEKARTLPAIAASLARQGYQTSFLYGGDINFTNTKGYLLATGYQQTRGYETFPRSVRHQHSWGVNDHVTLDTLYNIIGKSQRPYFATCLTLSSHEDWQVPYHRIKGDEVANAMAYLDDCIGRFVSRLKDSSEWDNLLLIILPDHGIAYPRGTTEANPERNHIPLLWIGGAIKAPRRIETLCNQTDLAATLLGQLGIDHRDFQFCRDVLSRDYTYPFAVHTFSGGVTFIDSTGFTVEDINARRIISEQGAGKHRTALSHAYLQQTITDFSKR